MALSRTFLTDIITIHRHTPRVSVLKSTYNLKFSENSILNTMVSVKQVVPRNPKVKNIKKTNKLEKVKKKNAEESVRPPYIQEKLSKVVSQKAEPKPIEKKKVKYVMPSKSITENLVTSSLNALQQLAVHYQKKNTIFEDETPIFVEINCIKIQNSNGTIKFVLPHSTLASTGEVCFITPDLKKGRKVDHEPTVDHWEDKLRTAGVTAVKTVLPMRQLRVEYDQYELKRRLLTQHDFILVDTRVLNHVSHLLGKMFFKKHNMLVPVRINEKGNLKKDIDIGLRTAMLRLNEGATSVMFIGHTGMKQNHLKENIIALVKQLQEKYPGGEANIRSISLKFPLSLSLPLYLTLRPSSAVIAPKLKHKKPRHFTVVEDELSTILGRTVSVAPDGTVHVKKSKDNLSDEEDMEQDEDNEEAEQEQDSNNEE